MNLNFISSEVLLDFNKKKHYGLFVYLQEDNKNYSKGLYYGGIDGWVKLSNDVRYGPWSTFKDFCDFCTGKDCSDEEVENYLETVEPGLTIGIFENNEVFEYWNPVYGKGFVKKTKEIYDALIEVEKVTATSLNYLNDRKADRKEVEKEVEKINETIDAIPRVIFEEVNIDDPKSELVRQYKFYYEDKPELPMFIDISKDRYLKSVKYFSQDKDLTLDDITWISNNCNDKEHYIDIYNTLNSSDSDSNDYNIDEFIDDINEFIDFCNSIKGNMVFVYYKSDGTTDEVRVNINETITENEIKKNMQLDSDRSSDKITVTANVGNLKPGDKIDYDSDIRELLKQILSKEEWASGFTNPSLTGYTIKATVGGVANQTVSQSYEIGTTISNVSVVKPTTDTCNGTIKSYKNQVDIVNINAGCTWDGDYNITESINGYIKSGSNSIVKFNRKYTVSTASTVSNLGSKAGPNDTNGIKINAGTTSTISQSATGYYKLYWGIMDREKAKELNAIVKPTADEIKTNPLVVYDKDKKIKEYFENKSITTTSGTVWATDGVSINSGKLNTITDEQSFVFYCINTYKPSYTEMGLLASIGLEIDNTNITYKMPSNNVNDSLYNLYVINNTSEKNNVKFVKV